MIAVSIVTYHTSDDELRQVISFLTPLERVVRIDIIDNSRDPRTRRLVESIGDSRVSYTPSPNVGYGAGNNISIRRSLADPQIKYHLVINSDLQFAPATVAELASIMDSDPQIGLTIPKVTRRDGSEQSSYHPLPSPLDLLCHRFAPRSLCRRRMDRYEIFVDGLQEPVDVPYVYGCFMMMRVDALRVAGLFDERFFMYPEDVDMTRRLHERYRTLVIPWLSIVHDHRAASRRSLRMLWIHAFNMLRYFRKWGWR